MLNSNRGKKNTEFFCCQRPSLVPPFPGVELSAAFSNFRIPHQTTRVFESGDFRYHVIYKCMVSDVAVKLMRVGKRIGACLILIREQRIGWLFEHLGKLLFPHCFTLEENYYFHSLFTYAWQQIVKFKGPEGKFIGCRVKIKCHFLVWQGKLIYPWRVCVSVQRILVI